MELSTRVSYSMPYHYDHGLCSPQLGLSPCGAVGSYLLGGSRRTNSGGLWGQDQTNLASIQTRLLMDRQTLACLPCSQPLPFLTHIQSPAPLGIEWLPRSSSGSQRHKEVARPHCLS